MSVEMYRSRMTDYYPQILRAIDEFKAIIESEAPEIDAVSTGHTNVVNDAYLSTMSNDRVLQWEQLLGIRPLEDSTLDDRRDTIIARIRGQGKLNTTLINSIVNSFTGGTAESWIEDGVLYVEITPPPNSKAYRFENVEQELAKKVPAHLGLQVSRNYYEWGGVKKNLSTWQDVRDFGTWNSVYLFVPFTKSI